MHAGGRPSLASAQSSRCLGRAALLCGCRDLHFWAEGDPWGRPGVGRERQSAGRFGSAAMSDPAHLCRPLHAGLLAVGVQGGHAHLHGRARARSP